jgi:hypothetical protein
MPYAENTEVPPERSQLEIAGLIRKYGASGFISGWQGNQAMVEFLADGRRVRFTLTMPDDPKNYARTPQGRSRDAEGARKALDGEVRRRWRALALVIKAKLEVVQSGITTFETEFMANIVMPDNRTVAEHVVPAIQESYARGHVCGQLLAIEGSRP